MEVTNYVLNPGFEGGNLNGYWNSRGRMTTEIGGAIGCPGANGRNVMLWQQNGPAIASSQTADITVPHRVTVKPGQWVRAGFRAWSRNKALRVRSGATLTDENGVATYRFGEYVNLSPDGVDATFLTQVPNGVVGSMSRVAIQAPAGMPEGGDEEVRFDNFYMYVGDAPGELPTRYFDGSFLDGQGYAYRWNGTPNASTSYRYETLDRIHPWTRSWWDFLPSVYRNDRVQNPEIGGYPMLRFMNGIGQIAGEVRDLTDAVWRGEFMNPATTPDHALSWLAQLMGTDERGRRMPNAELRQFLVDMSAEGRVAVGTKLHIQNVAKNFLTNDRRVAVVPSTQRRHSLILVVAENDMPGLNVPAFITKVRESGVVPAGHEIVVSLAVSTWDGWSEAAGVTWDDLESRVKTWSESDALGVVLE